jgi:hypothetical protein
MKFPWFTREPEPEERVSTPAHFAHESTGKLDLHSSTWAYISEYATKEIERLRGKNDAMLDEQQTAAIRGQIKFAKRLLALGNPKADNTRRLSEVDDD